MCAPSSVSSIITGWDSLNSSLSSLSHLKGVPGLSDFRKCSMRSLAVKAYDQEHRLVMFVGVGSHILHEGISCMTGHWWR